MIIGRIEKNILQSLICLLFTINSSGQKTEKDIIQFNVTSGAAGYTSGEIEAFQKLLSSNDYSAIRKKLLEGTEKEQVLSAILIIEEYSLYPDELSQVEVDKLYRITKSQRKFSLYFTCLHHEEGTLEQLF